MGTFVLREARLDERIMQAAIQIPQPLSDFLAPIPQSAAWFALVACAVVVVTLIFSVVVIRRLGTLSLTLFVIAGIIILVYDLYSKMQGGKTWSDITGEYLPQFASEIIITFLAVAILERSIAFRDHRQERRAEIRRNALGALLYYVRFCNRHNLQFTIHDRQELNDDLAAFNKRKANRMASMSGKEQALFEAASEAVNKLVAAVNNDNVSADDRQRAIVDSANTLRTKYQEYREIFWEAAPPNVTP
jgi:hypothetical protein